VFLAREIVQLARQLAIDPFTAGSSDLIGAAPQAQPVLDAIHSHFPGVDPRELLALVMRALEVEASEPRGQAAKVECVTTLPVAPLVPTRPTRTVIREMITAGRRCVLIAGYMITDGSGVIPLAHHSAARGLDVTLICDSGNDDAARIKSAWPAGVTAPRILINSPDGPTTGKMHAKVLLVDENDLLVTSANFTHHGHAVNVEYGLRLSGEPARRTAAFFRTIEEQGVLVECN
jgi:phosphatidylserine/phosphatidylglycerophosphate/cardiolipin synthase-like enzyme